MIMNYVIRKDVEKKGQCLFLRGLLNVGLERLKK
jgi:hypothetical protein